MNTQPTVFAQIMAFLPMTEFRKCVRRYHGNCRVRKFSCFDQFFCLVFALLTCRESLRWQVELFFRWIKQNLRIKSFYGTSENAIRKQIWVAIAIYALVAIIRKRMDLKPPLYNILQNISVTAFEIVPLNHLLNETDDQDSMAADCNQIVLFDL